MKVFLTLFIAVWQAAYCQGLLFTNPRVVLTVFEEEPIGSFVVRAQASPDPEVYRLVGDAQGFFTIDARTGNITVHSRIDREVLVKTDGSFTVKVNNSRGEEASAFMQYWILDINDNLPYFPKQSYNVSVGEAFGIGRQIFSVSAIDDDAESNAEIIYEIVGGNEDGVFKLEDPYQGRVFVNKTLDYETKSSYTLNITASNNSPGLSNWTLLYITVTDDDDQPARFSVYEYSASIREDATVGTSIIQVTAEDQDRAINAPVTYEIDESTNAQGLFVINGSTGVMSLNGSLDREAVAEYRITVLAYSTSHLPDHVTVVIQISDVNDSPPVFLNQTRSFTIGENADLGAKVGQVEASDADLGDNASFSYSLLGGEGRFSINSSTGVVVVNGSLDRETKDNYTLVVVAEETLTAELLRSNVTVFVRVLDRNDNSPVFVERFYVVALDEELPSDTLVVQVFANDSDFSSNSLITYSLVPDINDHYQYFDINSINGSIITSKQLDRENISEFYLTVKAVDGAQPSLQRWSTVSVKVTLLDINDNIPVFEEQVYTATIMESAKVNSTILSVMARDKDVGRSGEVTYTLNGNIAGDFSIDHRSGSINVARKLDREKVGSYSLVVRATDGGNQSSTANVTVYISDDNDNSPQFTSPGGYHFSVVEGTADLFVGTVKANDSDIEENAEISYSLLVTPTSTSFRINASSGDISTAKALDYEEHKVHLLLVQAEDQGSPTARMTAVKVSINVTDINDNAPEFVETQLQMNIQDNQPPCGVFNKKDYFVFRVQDFTPADIEIGRVMACDKDSSTNALTFYRIQGNGSEVFHISNLTGVIRTTQRLNRATQPTYNLTVIAENSLASPRLTSNVTVHVIIYDVSDAKPTFSESEYRAEIAESATVGSSVITVNATDTSQAAFKFVYKMLYDQSSAGSRAFIIDAETGLITTQGQLDRETTSNYTLMVQAQVLNGFDGFSSVVPVYVDVGDVNDNYPRFLQRKYSFTPSELSRVGDAIGHVQAVDVDSDNKSDVIYEIISGNDKGLFNISEVLGTIYVIHSLDHVTTSTFQLVITAREYHVNVTSRKRRDVDVNFDEVTVTIEVQDVNNNRPVFTQADYIGGFYENVTRDTVVAKVQAFDEDFNAYGTVKYSIIDPEVPSPFSLDSITGEVKVSDPSAIISGKLKYSLTVSAVDNLGRVPFNRANRNASVHIFLLNISNELSLELGVHPEFIEENRDEIERMLHNLTGAAVIIREIEGTGDGKSVIYFHAVVNGTFVLLSEEEFKSRLQNRTDMVSGVYSKWNIRMSPDPTAEESTGSDREFSAIVAAMLVLSVGIGVAGIIGICIVWRKKNWEKTVYKTGYIEELPYQPSSLYSMDIPGIEAFIDSKADGTRSSQRHNTKYNVQQESNKEDHSSLADKTSLFGAPRRGSSKYRLQNGIRKEKQRKESVELSHYQSSPTLAAGSEKPSEPHQSGDRGTNDHVTTTRDIVDGHENMALDCSQENEEKEEMSDVTQETANSPEERHDKKEAHIKDRRVRFDLRGVEDKWEKCAINNYPDIIVISEEGSHYLDSETASVGSTDYEEIMPTDLSSIFEDSNRRANDPNAITSAINDDEGAVTIL